MGLPFEDLENGNGQTTSYGSGNPKFILDSLSASPYNSANKFSFHLTQGSLKFVNLHAKLSGSYPLAKFLVPNTWKTKFSIENETSLVLNRPISITRLEDDRQFVPDKLENLEYEIEFEHTTVTPATSSTYLTSYADVTFGNLRTYSGDVNKVKLFGRQKDQQNKEFEKFGEFILQTNNELKDSTSVTGNDPIGIFYSQSVVDNFWQSSSAAQPISTNNSRIMNAVLVSGSNYTDGSYVEFKTKNQFELEKNEEYIVSFKSYYIKKNKQQADGSVRQSAEIEVFLSGSITSQTGDVLSLGSVSDFGDNASELLRGNVSGSIPILYNYFTTHKKSGAKPKAGLVFRVNAGEFYISDVKLEPISDRNFNPGFYKTFVPMPKTARRGQRYDFVAEFYDSDNNKSDFEAVTSASVLFAGAKQVLADGEDAVLTGSVLIGNSLEMYGVNPAYLRSVGYNGFDKTIAGTGDRNGGFMLFSGSVGTAIGASETYNGVGLEVVDASGSNKFNHSFLQFASNYKGTGSPRFRVQTSEFLLGISGSGVAGDAYISGSQGNLEMSSSNFFLKQDGSVTMQGTITATAGGTIGGFTIGSSSLSVGSVFQISSSQNANDPASFISSSAFKVSAGGKVTGSNVLFTGGKVGGIVLSSTGIASADSNPAFQVTASTGQITGSLVKFDGGTIGGFSINSQEIKTSDFQPGVKGVLISSKGNGFLEVEEAKIRGTLSTTVFEKESVNAVGGQLLVANSTTITGSNAVSASQVTMSVANVTGFEQNEILLLKKVSGTGFNTEYVRVISSSRDGANDNDTRGRIMVERGYQSGSAVFAGAKHSGSIAEISENSSSYEPGQVLVSTGKINTGYIRLNANPNDVTTPYIDIVERTGSGVFDVDLKARLGDLSGISSTLVGSSPGFGLFSENVFLTGKITATSGEIGGFAITSNAVSSSNGNLRLKSNGQITGSAVDLSGKLTATSGEIAGWDISGNTIRKLSGNAGITLDSGKSQIIASGSNTITTGNGVIIDGVNGILQVSQSGTTIFESGINTQFRLIPDFFVKSQPTALVADSRLAATPLTLVTDISASKKTVGGISGIGGRISVHQAFVEEGFRMTTKDAGTSFLYNASRTIDGANEDVPVPVIFDDQRTVDIASNADYMHQSYVFNTNYISDDSADAIRFVANGATTGSATFQIQATLTDTSDNNFTDAKLNLLGLDVDTSTLPTARQNEYTFLQARHSSSIRAQLQHDGDFVSAGNLTAFGTSFLQVSDERLKQNIYTISQSLDKILDLRPTKYVWKKNKKQDVGFIAQEVEKIIPEVVEESRGFINDDSQIENMKTISYPKLIPYLVDTIQVLVKRIEDLEERFVKK